MPRDRFMPDPPVVQHHLYGGPCSGDVMGFSGSPQFIRKPIPGTAHAQEVGHSLILDMATYIRVTYDGGIRYVHEDIWPMMRLGGL